MKTLAVLAATLLALTVASADSTHGIKPRKNAAAYPAFQLHQSLSLGAEQLSKKQIEHSFATELDRRYIVVEIGVFPTPNGKVNLSPSDFVLRVKGTKDILRPSSPEMIAQVLYKRPATTHDVTVTPVGSIGYESGGRDMYGNRYPGGMTTSAGAMVGVSSNKVGGTEADRKTMETELRDKQLPVGEVAQPVCGYLYFPVSTSKKVQYELEYSGNGETIALQLPSPRQ